jgi:uncharacterized LabA/DUF88 family protein
MPTPLPATSIALLIDSDNAPASKIEYIISELAKNGVVNIRRAYGNWTKPQLSGWEKVLHEYAIQPIQNFDLTKGKNAADMALVIDAMDILYTKEVTAFALVTSDCDFTPLAQRLRAEGKQVIGFGGKTTPEPFINSCTRFLLLDTAAEGKSSQPDNSEHRQKALRQNKDLLRRLLHAVQENEDEDGWTAVGVVGNYLRNQGSFDQSNYGYSKLSTLLHDTGLFEEDIKKTGSGSAAWVRPRTRPSR